MTRRIRLGSTLDRQGRRADKRLYGFEGARPAPGAVASSADEIIIHAMPMRPKYRKLLEP